MINVTKSSMPDYDEYIEEIKDLWDSHWLTNMGIKHQQLESKLKEFLSINDVILFTNGHLALEAIWEAFDFPKGSEVITTPFTFCSTTHAFARKGLTPVFCDINPKNYCIDADKIESLITDKTVAICPVHVYGNMCDVEKIEQIAKKHNLKIIYDAAHAFGVKYKGIQSAHFGDASMFSFHATKVFNTIEGGAVCLNNDIIAGKLNELKNFGMRSPECVPYIGFNAKMNEFQAAMGLCNLKHLDSEIAKRKRAHDRYETRLNGIKGITLCPAQEDVVSNYAYMPVLFDGFYKTRDEIFEQLKNHGIVARKYFYPLINEMDCYKNNYDVAENPTPVAKHVGDSILTLPLYADLSLEDVDKICDIILSKE